MKNKNIYGFTLIELLAVIVVLAIIMVIATQQVNKAIKKSEKSAFETTAKSIVKAVELEMVSMPEKYDNLPKVVDVKDLDIDNKEEVSGTVTVKEEADGSYSYYLDISNDKYAISGTKITAEEKSKVPTLTLKGENGVIDNANGLIYSIDNKLYPQQLKVIPNPHQVLYLEGNTNLLRNPMIAIIGSRSCTKNGILLAQKFSYELSQCGITVVSGLAKRY